MSVSDSRFDDFVELLDETGPEVGVDIFSTLSAPDDVVTIPPPLSLPSLDLPAPTINGTGDVLGIQPDPFTLVQAKERTYLYLGPTLTASSGDMANG